MGCNAEKLQIRTAEKRGLFSSLFSWAGRLFANCSNLPQRIATIVWHNKGALRENGTDIPHNLRKVLPAKAHAGTFSCGCGRSSGAQQAHKKLSPVSMRGNSQNGGQTTKSLLIKQQCSGVPIQQAVSLSSSFPRHCLLFVYAFFREMPESARSEELPLPPPPAYKTAPASCYGNRGGSFALGTLFQALTQNLARGLLVSPAYAGKSSARELLLIVSRDHPRVCGEKGCCKFSSLSHSGSPPHMRGKVVFTEHHHAAKRINPAYAGKSTLPHHRAHFAMGSPPRMRGKVSGADTDLFPDRITPAYAGKGPPDACSQPYA